MRGSSSMYVGILSLCAASQGAAPLDRTGMVETEYAFARRAQTSVRAAFLEYLAEDSLVLAPGPTPGRPRYLAAKEDQNRLEWYPSVADVAGSGDLGFTSGPWMYTAAATGAQLYGHFVTVWKRDAHSVWRVQLDGGVSHAAPHEKEASLAPDGPQASAARVPRSTAAAGDAVNRAIGDFQVAAAQNDLGSALRTFARNSDFSLYTEGEQPMALGPATRYLGTRSMPVDHWHEVAREHSADATIAYSVGEFGDENGRARSAYIQIWQYDPKVANWGVRVLLIAPLSPEKKKS